MSVIKKIYSSEYTVIASLFLGAYFGLYFKEQATYTYFLGDMYMKLLQIAVVPLVIFTISKSIYEMSSSSTRLVTYAFFLSIIITIISVAASILFTVVVKPWSYIEHISDFNSLFVNLLDDKQIELSIYDKYVPSANTSLIDFAVSVIPHNVFEALDKGNMLQIVFASTVITFFFIVFQKRKIVLKIYSLLLIMALIHFPS